MSGPLIVKLGGELLEEPGWLQTVVSALARIVGQEFPGVVIVHGGGKEIDAALTRAGIDKRQVDGLRITDELTLDVVVSVLAGAVNTRLVAALSAAGVAAVGLTGVDGRCGVADLAPPHRAVDGRTIDLGRVGIPSSAGETRLLTTLIDDRFVPVIACIGLERDGRLLNVNADTFAGHLAGRLRARRLVIAGTTRGVLDGAGATVAVLEPSAVARLIEERTATAGMVAKLRACEHALASGVADVVIVDGQDRAALVSAALDSAPPTATRLIPAAVKTCATTGGA